MNLLYLPTEILLNIIQYITLPSDLKSMMETCTYINELCKKYTNIIDYDGYDSYLHVEQLDLFPNLIYSYNGIRIESYYDLDLLIEKIKLKELVLRIASDSEVSIMGCINYLIQSEYLNKRRIKLLRYRPEIGGFESFWIGDLENPMVGADAFDIFNILLSSINNISHICIDNLIFKKPLYLRLLNRHKIESITYLDCGFEAYTMEQFLTTLLIFDQLKYIRCSPCLYEYDIDPDIRYNEVDKLVTVLNNVYPNIEELILPFHFEDINDLTHYFPNLKHIGIRCEYEVSDKNFIVKEKETYKFKFDELEDGTDTDIDDLLNKYEKITIFLSVIPETKYNFYFSRHPESMSLLNFEFKNKIKSIYPQIDVIDMTNDPNHYYYSRDIWLFPNFK